VLWLVRRHRRWLAAIAVVVAVAGAFLTWGPVGLGNGPLWLPAGSGGEYSWTEPQIEPVVFVIPIGNAGHGAAIIDSVSVTGSPRFAPSILRQALIGQMAGYDCFALGAFSGRTSALAGCVQPLLKSAAGAVIPVGTYPARRVGRKGEAALVLELAGPRPGRCWDITSVVVRYHIGIRHYVGTFAQANVITCGVGGKVPALT
jgi:hypothetical protein